MFDAASSLDMFADHVMFQDEQYSGSLPPCSTVTYVLFANTTSMDEYLNIDLSLSNAATATNTMTLTVNRVIPGSATVGPAGVVPLELEPCTVKSGSEKCPTPIVVACQYSAVNGSVYYLTLTTPSSATVSQGYTLTATVEHVGYTQLELQKKKTVTAVQPTASVLKSKYMFFDVPVPAERPEAGSRVTFTIEQANVGQLVDNAAFANFEGVPCGPSDEMGCNLGLVAANGCAFSSSVTCTLYLDACTVAEFGGGSYTLALSVAQAGGSFSIKTNVTQPLVTPLRSGVPVVGALPDTIVNNMYSLDVSHANLATATLTLAVTTIENGEVRVGQAFDRLPFESCATHGATDTSIVCESETANCHYATQSCDLKSGTYYFAVDALTQGVVSRDVTYVITATLSNRPAPLALASHAAPLPQSVHATAYNMYALPHTGGMWMNVHVYLDSSPDASDLALYINKNGVAGAGPDDDLCFEHQQTCSMSSSSNPGCTLQVSPCDLGPESTPWFATVAGGEGNFYGIPTEYTINYELAMPIVLTPGYVHAQSYQIKAGIYQHFVIETPWLGKAVDVVINATVSSIHYYIQYERLAGACPCYSSEYDGTLSVTTPGVRDSAVITLENCGPAPGHGKIYVGVLGTDASAQFSKYIVSYRVRDPYVAVPIGPNVVHDLVLPSGVEENTVQYFAAVRPPLDAFLRVEMTGAFGTVSVLVDEFEKLSCPPAYGDWSCSPKAGVGAACVVVVPPCELEYAPRTTSPRVTLATEGTQYDAYSLTYSYIVPPVVPLRSKVAYAAAVEYGIPSRFSIGVPSGAFVSLVVELYVDAGQHGSATLFMSRDEIPGPEPCRDYEFECSTSTRCVLVLEPCDVAPGVYYMTVESSFNQADISDLSYTLTASLIDAATEVTKDTVLPTAVDLFDGQVQYYYYNTRDVSAADGSVYTLELGNVQDGTIKADLFYGAPKDDCGCLVYQQSHSLSAPGPFGVFDVGYCQVDRGSVVTLRVEGTSTHTNPAQQVGGTLRFFDNQHKVADLAMGKTSDDATLSNTNYAMYHVVASPSPPSSLSLDAAGNDKLASHASTVTRVTVTNLTPYTTGDIEVYVNYGAPATADCADLYVCSGVANCSIHISPCDASRYMGEDLYVSVRAATSRTNPIVVTTQVESLNVPTLAEGGSVQLSLKAPEAAVVAVLPTLDTDGVFTVTASNVAGGSARVRLIPSLCIEQEDAPVCTVGTGSKSCSVSASGCQARLSPDTASTYYVEVNGVSGSPSLSLNLAAGKLSPATLTSGSGSETTLTAQTWGSFVIATPGSISPNTHGLNVTLESTTSGGSAIVYVSESAIAFDYTCSNANCTAAGDGTCQVHVGACCLKPGTNYFVSVFNPSQTESVSVRVTATVAATASQANQLELSDRATEGVLTPEFYAEYKAELAAPLPYGASLVVVVNSTKFLSSSMDVYLNKAQPSGAGVLALADGSGSSPECFQSFTSCKGTSVCVLQLYALCGDGSSPAPPVINPGTYVVGIKPTAPTTPSPSPTPDAFDITMFVEEVADLALGSSVSGTVLKGVSKQYVARLPGVSSDLGTFTLTVTVSTGSVTVFTNAAPSTSVGPPNPAGIVGGVPGVQLAGSSSASPCLTASPAAGTSCTSATSPCTITVSAAYCEPYVVRVGVVGGTAVVAGFSLELKADGKDATAVSLGQSVSLAAAGGTALYNVGKGASPDESVLVVEVNGVATSGSVKVDLGAHASCAPTTKPGFATQTCSTKSCAFVFTSFDLADTPYMSDAYHFSLTSTAVTAPASPPTVMVTEHLVAPAALAADGSVHEVSLAAPGAAAFVFEPSAEFVRPGQSLVLNVGGELCGSMRVFVRTGSLGGSLLASETCSPGPCALTLVSSCDALDAAVVAQPYYVVVVADTTNYDTISPTIPDRVTLQMEASGNHTVYNHVELGAGVPALVDGLPAAYVYEPNGRMLGNFANVQIELVLARPAVNTTVLTAQLNTPVVGCGVDSSVSCTVETDHTRCSVDFAVCSLGTLTSAPYTFPKIYMVATPGDSDLGYFTDLVNASIWVMPDTQFVRPIKKTGNYSGAVHRTMVENYAVPLTKHLESPRFRLEMDLYVDPFEFHVERLGIATGGTRAPQCGGAPGQGWPTQVTVDYCQAGTYYDAYPWDNVLFASVVANTGYDDLLPYHMGVTFEPEVIVFGRGPECFTMGPKGLMFFEIKSGGTGVRIQGNVTTSVGGVQLYGNVGRLASPACHADACTVSDSGRTDAGYGCDLTPLCPTGHGAPSVFFTVKAEPGTKFIFATAVEHEPLTRTAAPGLQPTFGEPLMVSGAGSVDKFYEVPMPRGGVDKSSVVVVWAEGLDSLMYSWSAPYPVSSDECGQTFFQEEAALATTCSGYRTGRLCYAVIPCGAGAGSLFLHAQLDEDQDVWPWSMNTTAPWSFNVTVVDMTAESVVTKLDLASPFVVDSLALGTLGVYAVDVDTAALTAGSSQLSIVVSGVNDGDSMWVDVVEYPVDGATRDNLCYSVGSSGTASGAVVGPAGSGVTNVTVPACRTHAAKYTVLVFGASIGAPPRDFSCAGVGFQLEAVITNALPEKFVEVSPDGPSLAFTVESGASVGYEVAYRRAAVGPAGLQALVITPSAVGDGEAFSGTFARTGSFLPTRPLCSVDLEGDKVATVIPGCVAVPGRDTDGEYYLALTGGGAAGKVTHANVTITTSSYTALRLGGRVSGTLATQVGSVGWKDTHLYQVALPRGYTSTAIVVEVGEGGAGVEVHARNGACDTDGSGSASYGASYLEDVAVFKCKTGRCVWSFRHRYDDFAGTDGEAQTVNLLVRGAATSYNLTVGAGAGNCGARPAPFCAGAPSSSWVWAEPEAQNTGAELLFDKLYCAYRECDSPCPREVSARCNATLRAFACASTFPACDRDGNFMPPCGSLCQAVTAACGRPFERVGLFEYSCERSAYVQDGPCTGQLPAASPSKGLSAGLIVLIVLAVLLVIGCCIAAVWFVIKKSDGRSGYAPIGEDAGAINEPTPTPVSDPGPPPAAAEPAAEPAADV